MSQSVGSLPEPVITVSRGCDLTEIVKQAFDDARNGRGDLDPGVYGINGFCGRKHRLLANNLVARIPNPRYLEIGIFMGATLCAAISGNAVFALGIDNWSEYGGPENEAWRNAAEFYRNLAAARGPRSVVTILEQDFRTAPIESFGRFNIGFYDGSHSEEDQYDGARIVLRGLQPRAILMVDDWNWTQVRDGTSRALRDENAHIDFMIEVRTTQDDSLVGSEGFGGMSDWHNGLMVAVVSK
jgi:hypothetical protein